MYVTTKHTWLRNIQVVKNKIMHTRNKNYVKSSIYKQNILLDNYVHPRTEITVIRETSVSQ